MITTIARKEWREHRGRYLAYWLVLNAPILLLALMMAVSQEARVPFAGLTDATLLRHLPLALVESLAVASIFLFVTGYLAVPMFNRQAEAGAVFFLHEQPISRRRYAVAKLVVGGLQVVAAVVFAVLFAVVVAWGLMLAGGKVSWDGSGTYFWLVFAAALRACVWAALLSVAVFTGAALISAVSPRWWMAGVGVLVFVAAGLILSGGLFDFTPDNIGADTLSIGVDFHFGESKPWITMSRALQVDEVRAFAPWKPIPLLVAAGLTLLFSWLLQLVYQRGDVASALGE